MLWAKINLDGESKGVPVGGTTVRSILAVAPCIILIRPNKFGFQVRSTYLD